MRNAVQPNTDGNSIMTDIRSVTNRPSRSSVTYVRHVRPSRPSVTFVRHVRPSRSSVTSVTSVTSVMSRPSCPSVTSVTADTAGRSWWPDTGGRRAGVRPDVRMLNRRVGASGRQGLRRTSAGDPHPTGRGPSPDRPRT